MAVEINQNEQNAYLNEKRQEMPSGSITDEFASLNMDSVNIDSVTDIQLETDDCFIEDDIDKVTASFNKPFHYHYIIRPFLIFFVRLTLLKTRFKGDLAQFFFRW